MTAGLERLRIQRETGFQLDTHGRIVGVNSPEGLEPPRFVLAGCADGNLASVSAVVDETTAAELLALSLEEPPFWRPGTAPLHLRRYLEILGAAEAEIELDHELAAADLPSLQINAELVASGSPEGEELFDTLRRDGMPAGLFDMGFVDVGEFWAPWCAALVENEAISIAFAARVSNVGAAVGVATAPGFRGRDLASAVVAGWSRLPALQGRRLFYSCRLSNQASRSVAARLGLTAFGLTFSVS